MKITKGIAFTISLILFALIELWIVIYDFTHPFRDDFSLDSYRVIVSNRSVEVMPMTFEVPFHEYVDNIVNIVGEEVASDLMSDIYTTEKILHPDKFTKKEEKTDDELVFGLFRYEEPEEDGPKEDFLPVDENNKAKIALIIDDMGVTPSYTQDIINLESPLNASFLTYGSATKQVAKKARKKGFEIMLHVPMMPYVEVSLAPVTLSPDMSDDEIKEKFEEMLARYEGIKIRGINNHMGSRFTEDKHAMSVIMKILKKKDMFFVDSRTTPKTVGKEVAEEYGVPYIARDVFLDNDDSFDSIMGQLLLVEQTALKKGFAVAIGHPRKQTINALRTWLDHLDTEKFELIHITDLMRALNKIDQNQPEEEPAEEDDDGEDSEQ